MELAVIVENKNQEYVCNVCGKEFETKGNMDRHQKRKYSCVAINEDKYKCGRCGKLFNRKCNLTAHLNKKTLFAAPWEDF